MDYDKPAPACGTAPRKLGSPIVDIVSYLIDVNRALGRELSEFQPGGVVTHVYNPLRYAFAPWQQYLERYAQAPKRAVFSGMNPGPWGMVQTGIPFGEVEIVRDWLGMPANEGRPPREHSKRPVQGFACRRSEVSGSRLWGLFRQRFATPERFFTDHLVLNYCPLAFMAESGRNVTPDKLPADARHRLFAACNRALARQLAAVGPEFAVGIGIFAETRLRELTDAAIWDAACAAVAAAGLDPAPRPPRIVKLLHPSPASPAANRGWAEAATAQLQAAGVWTVRDDR